MQEAIALERDCYMSIKANFQHFQQIFQVREAAEATITTELSVFDTALDKALAEVAGSAGPSTAGGGGDRGGGGPVGGSAEKDLRTDYLLPYLRNIKDLHRISKEEALEIRQNCLDALKARLVSNLAAVQCQLSVEYCFGLRSMIEFML